MGFSFDRCLGAGLVPPSVLSPPRQRTPSKCRGLVVKAARKPAQSWTRAVAVCEDPNATGKTVPSVSDFAGGRGRMEAVIGEVAPVYEGAAYS